MADQVGHTPRGVPDRNILNAMDLADMLAAMGVVTNLSSNSSSLSTMMHVRATISQVPPDHARCTPLSPSKATVHFRPAFVNPFDLCRHSSTPVDQTSHGYTAMIPDPTPRPMHHMSHPSDPYNSVLDHTSAPPPAQPLGLWRAATDGHVNPSAVDTSSLLLNTFAHPARGSGIWSGTRAVHPRHPSPPRQSFEDAQLTRLTRRDVYSFSRLSTVFHLPQHKACSELRAAMETEGQVGYRLSSLKLLIKSYNLQRWPYRKV